MLGGIGVQEILIILVVGLLVFGAARLPKIARSLGLGIKEFKKTIKGIDDEEEGRSSINYVQNQPPLNQPQGYQYNSGMQNPQPGQFYAQNPPNYQNKAGNQAQQQGDASGGGNPNQTPQQERPQDRKEDI